MKRQRKLRRQWSHRGPRKRRSRLRKRPRKRAVLTIRTILTRNEGIRREENEVRILL